MLARIGSAVALGLAMTPGALPDDPATGPGRDRIARVEAGLPATGQWRQGFAVADLDGDGDLDLAHGPPRAADGVPRLFLNDGRGAFSPWSRARFPGLRLDYGDVAAADFDGDGRIDLAFGVHLRGVGILLGDGSGGFLRAPGGLDWSGEAEYPTVALEAVDWDGDGRVDLLALGEGPRPGDESGYGLRLFRNLPGRWQPIAGEDPGRLFGDGLAVGDFDGDGRPDAAAASRSLQHRGQVFLGRGGAGWVVAEAPRRPSAYLFAVAVCDVDGDGRDELAAGFLERRGERWRSGVDLLDLDTERGWTRRPIVERAGDDPPRALACGKVDGDGEPDLVVGSSRGTLTLLRGDGRGGFRRPRSLAGSAANGGCAVRHLELADLDGDGGAELIASFAAAASEGCSTGGALRVWRGQGRREP